MNEKFIKYEDVVLCTESFGNKKDPVILLIAGATVSMLYWDEAFCRQLESKGFFVIRYDNRDTGKSSTYAPGTTPYNIVNLVDDAIAILDEYNVEKAHLAGISLGGLIAQIAALKYPERVQSLILMSTGPWGDPDPGIPEMDKGILKLHQKAETVDWADEDEVVLYVLELSELMKGRKPLNRKRIEKMAREEFRRASNYTSLFNHAALQGGEEWLNRLNEIEQPSLIIHGTDDQIWHFKHTRILTRELKGSALVALEGTGHELNDQDWPIIAEAIAEFIEAR
jgi:pimeloyl-ACP methyl ester carboxylesterase